MINILISNDDGIYGNGLKPLIRALKNLGNVHVVVPDSERSAASHSITLHKPFRVQTFPIELSKNETIRVHATNGTPADCVRFGILKVLKNKKIDLVVSGINHGFNLGEDTVYSGTVAVAREAAMLQIPSIAMSVTSAPKANFEYASKVCLKIAKIVLKIKLPPRVFLNVNVPQEKNPLLPLEITRLGRRIYGKEIPSGIDPRGQEFFWLAGDIPKGIPEMGTDIAAIKAGKTAITPLLVDSTHDAYLSELAGRVAEEEYHASKTKKRKN